jgi:hypothetical protein
MSAFDPKRTFSPKIAERAGHMIRSKCAVPNTLGESQMQVHELVARFAAAVETADPMNAARKVLEDLRGEIDHIEKMLGYISGVGGNAHQVFYRAPNLTMLKVCFPNGRRTPPHDHGT